ncbi:MAG: transposase [Oligoflexia bacterium]|nr:transposase [Oligoflexia bacterium]MBX7145442.1 transposase [Oligoflexia bacterium]
MEQSTAWEVRKAQQRRYSRRLPELSSLYRIISSCHEDLERVWEELYQETYGVLRREVVESFERYLQCGILAHGCARACCENKECKHSELIAFSCKCRGICPCCDAKRAIIFAENLVENVLLPYAHHHCTFTLPKRIRPFFKFNRKLLGRVHGAAWESWKELIVEQCPTATPAAVQALHSAGDVLGWHPHVHGLYLAGALLPDGSFQPVTVDQTRLELLFADKVLKALQHEGLLSQDDIDNMKSWEHSGFNVFIGEAIEPTDSKRLLFVARYLKKCPVSNERLTIVEGSGDTVIEYAAYKDGHKSVRTFSPLDFLAELQQHVFDSWEQNTRWFGAYSCRTRGEAALNATATPSAPNAITQIPEPATKPSASWARCMKKILEIDPLLCPRCGSQMHIKAFITDPTQVDKITSGLGLAQQRAPPKLRYAWPLAA